MANTQTSKSRDCFHINICACRENRCMIFPTTCVPENWKIEDFTKCENRPDRIKIPTH
ncbi:MAG: hypothetical protein Q9M89_02350 [Persephonella sp.]|nr:hypothetical protein [Persephonella sp.]